MCVCVAFHLSALWVCVWFVLLSVLATVVRTAQHGKTVRFLHVAFDTTGDSFLAGDHHGNIYVFDITRNRSVAIFICILFMNIFLTT